MERIAMNTRMTVFACPLIFCLWPAAVVADEQDSSKDRNAQVQAVFAAKCNECHGPQLQRPKGGVSLHDLRQLAANSDLVVAARPEKSALWEVIQNDEMPPSYARAGPLSEQEKEAIRAWIGSLPPGVPSQASPNTFSLASPQTRRQQSIFGWLGRFHILVIHFPIALLAAAALGELIAAPRRTSIPRPAVRFCVLLGAAGAALAVALGWLHADIGGHGSAASGVLGLHRWLGTGGGVCAAAIALVSERDCRRGQRSVLFRVLLWSGTLLVAATAHFGGVMVHGDLFLDW
jgi:mono/diheme cytochrome c family protein